MKVKYYITIFTLISIASSSIPAADTLYDTRFKQWQQKAETGDSFSQYSLGNAYLRGNEVSIDPEKAIHWFQVAAKQGHAKSEYKLGYLYYSGKNISRNYRTAFDWFQRAANRNYSPAQFYLGKMYAEGQGTNTDTTKALEWLNKALKNDYTPAAREIERTQQKIDTARAQQQESKPVEVKPVRKVVVVKRTPARQKKITAKKEKIEVAELLEQGNWTLDGTPSEILPSTVTECNTNADQLYCTTSEIHITTDYADVNYKVESIAGRFDNKRRSFTVKNKKNTLFVLPSDPDDPNVDPDNIPATGIVTQVMKCKFENDNNIRCYNDSFKKVLFSRQ